MRFKDSTELRSMVGAHFQGELGYGYKEYSASDSEAYFLLHTRDPKGEELEEWTWSMNWVAVEWLLSKGVTVERVENSLQVSVFHAMLDHLYDEAEHLVKCWADIVEVDHCTPHPSDWRRSVRTTETFFLDGNVLLGSEVRSRCYGNEWINQPFEVE
jgi:hypothetical protein